MTTRKDKTALHGTTSSPDKTKLLYQSVPGMPGATIKGKTGTLNLADLPLDHNNFMKSYSKTKKEKTLSKMGKMAKKTGSSTVSWRIKAISERSTIWSCLRGRFRENAYVNEIHR